MERTVSEELDRAKEALKRDLQQTKADLTGGRQGEDLNQTLGDTILQALGSEPIPAPGEPNPEPEVVPLDLEAAAPRCSACEAALVHEQDRWVCPSGHGHAAIYPVAGRRIGPVAVNAVRVAAEEAAAAEGRPCPFCGSAMFEVDLAWDETAPSALLHRGAPERGGARLEVCTLDRLIWFDRDSLDAIPDPTDVVA